ncbi:hypothetical protein CLHUN_35840 [Ruminiclostridium hungatei]|uniref:Uncharacterized protein n=1 Tax=Ruminiclostridium hungatei TaxID=48256 RepID=A0A1V4SF07_RUMHU|nr:hypothetical protein [Ruminiclostridium hungatei]OPX42448.1 hypothetical protein CLHUN_35730 [Ruminiclostridium hungatei]OPX42459.1 hypothetical protein CLHUN_35840 [Ruminiclostridium hungatei]
MKRNIIIALILGVFLSVSCSLVAYALTANDQVTQAQLDAYPYWIEVIQPNYDSRQHTIIRSAGPIPASCFKFCTDGSGKRVLYIDNSPYNFIYCDHWIHVADGWTDYSQPYNFFARGGIEDSRWYVSVVGGNYSLLDYETAELNILNPVDNNTYNTYQDIKFKYTGFKYLEVVFNDKNIADDPKTGLVENNILNRFYDIPGEYTIPQSEIPYSNSEYELQFYYSSDGSNYVFWKSISFKIKPPDKKSITCNLSNGQTYNIPQDLIIRSVGYSPYTIYVNDLPIRRIVADCGFSLSPSMGNISTGSTNKQDFYNYRIGKNTVKAIKDDGTVILDLSVTYLRELIDSSELPSNTVGDGKMIDLSFPQRSDYPDGILGDVQFGFAYLIYLITFPFMAIAKLFSILNNHFATFLNSTSGVANFFRQMFGFLPTEVLTVIVITITLSSFFVILRMVRR